jgi:hypothetical protein
LCVTEFEDALVGPGEFVGEVVFLIECLERGVAGNGIEAGGVVDFAKAEGAEVEWAGVHFLEVVRAIEIAFMIDAVADAEHVPNLMRHHLACTVQHQVFSLFWGTYFIPIEFG